ncbi:MAG TPA: hypothetical protein VJB62_02900, partial [Patescibacteria group bacterium]|nr:hypothetical protein [Patescibacteria group bacterium]
MTRNNSGSKVVPILIVVALALVVGVGLWKVFEPSGQQPGTTAVPSTAVQPSVPAPAPKGTVVISIASSNTKEDWLHRVTAIFNERAKTDASFQVGSKPVFVEIVQEKVDGKMKDYRSGTMISDTMNGKIKPTIISPGEMTWVDQINRDWKLTNNTPLIRSDCPEVVRTPIVIAMWQSRARALGAWPEAGPNGSWGKIRELAVNPDGWGLYGHKEWGKFKIGYGYFGQSNSGTLGTVLMAMIASGKTGKKNLEIGDISVDNAVGKFINGIEKAKVHSGKSDVWLLEQMIGGGPEYLDAVITYESNVIMMNQKHSGEMREPLVCVYPQ